MGRGRKSIIETETLFRLLFSKHWDSLIKILMDNFQVEELHSEPLFRQFIDALISELVKEENFSDTVGHSYVIDEFIILHNTEKYGFRFDDESYRKLLVSLASRVDYLYLAQELYLKFPKDPISEELYARFQKGKEELQKSKAVATTYDDITITEIPGCGAKDLTISLFKSRLEYRFYRAVRDYYPTYLVYPNVAINSVIAFDLIEAELTQEECAYFFRGLIDCVIIDHEDNYKPIAFFELDSIYHDSDSQQIKDSRKDTIISKAGKKLFRIRPNSSNSTEKQLKKAIEQCLDQM
jgi:hypothetical protein